MANSPRLNGRERTNEMNHRHGGINQRHGGRHHDHAEERGLGCKYGACFVRKVFAADGANGGTAPTVITSAAIRQRADLIAVVGLRHSPAVAFVQMGCRFHNIPALVGCVVWATWIQIVWLPSAPIAMAVPPVSTKS